MKNRTIIFVLILSFLMLGASYHMMRRETYDTNNNSVVDSVQGTTSGSIPFINSSLVLAEDNSNLFYDAINMLVGIGTKTPTHALNVVGDATGAQLRINRTSYAGGMYFIASQPDTGVCSVGSEWDGSNWVARATEAINFEMKDGWIKFRGDTGLTVGNVFTPTLLAQITKNLTNCRIGIGVEPAYTFHAKANTGNAFMVLETDASAIAGLALGDAARAYGGQVQYTNADDFMRLKADNTEIITIDGPNERVGISTVAPTAKLHLPAGTAAAGTAPLKLTAGVVNTTPELGTVEFTDNGTTGHLYITLNVGGVVTRKEISLVP